MFARVAIVLAASVSLVSATGVLNLGATNIHGLPLSNALGVGLGNVGQIGVPGIAIGQIAEQVVSSVPVVQTRVEPYDPHPVYGYSYTVHDSHTGDSKHQFETRNGDSVRGQYSLTEPDGNRRTVDYASEPHTGFNAVVHRTSPYGH